MKRRNFIAAVAGVVGGGKIAADRLLPDGPSPSREAVDVVEKGIDVDTPPGTEDVGNGYAYARVKNTVEYPLEAHVKFELLKDGHPYTYAHEHSTVSVLIQPGESRTLVESWTVSEFPESTEATGVAFTKFNLKNANKTWLGPSPSEE